MELVKVEDLEIGDEILLSCQGCFKYARVVRKPMVGKGTHWRTNTPMYKSVKCSLNRDENGAWKFTPDNHNFEQYLDLNYRDILLVRRIK